MEAYGEVRWLRMFLEFGIRDLGEIVDGMDVRSVREFVFDYVLRKVSTGAESAASVILELTKFWEYLQRVYQLPAPGPIIEWLKTDGLADELKAELANPETFDMAKSIIISGISSGYDMTSEDGIAEFIMAYNSNLRTAPEFPASEITASSPLQAGRNDPCPCGSGKKYKKCCIRRS